MGPVLSRPGLRAGFAGLAVAGAALVLSACSAQPEADNANLITGKQLFVQKCGSCHVLARAGTKGTTGPEPRRGLPAGDQGRDAALGLRRRHPRPDPAPQPQRGHAGQARHGRPGLRHRRLRGAVGRRRRQGHGAAGHRRQAGRRGQARRREERLAPDRRRPDRSARLRDRLRNRHARADHGQDGQQVRHAARHRHRRQGQGRDRPERRRVAVPGHLHGRELHVLLLGARGTARPACRASSRSSSARPATHPAGVLKLPLVPSE